MPVTRISASVDWSVKAGAGLWIADLVLATTGPRSSTGSPMTLMMRPSTSGPTGTEMGAPVSVASWPRVRPSVVSIATVRTVCSPRCCATSSTSALPWFSTVSAFRISGRSPSNLTSTTAPSTCVTRPTLLVAMLSSERISDRLGAGDDLDQLLGDGGLAGAVENEGEAIDHVAGVARRAVHRGHARAFLGRGVLEQRAIDLDREVARQQVGEDLVLRRLELVDGAAFELAAGADREGDELLLGDDLAHRRLEAVVEERRRVERTALEHQDDPRGDLVGDGKAEAAADIVDRVDDQRAEIAAQLVAALAADAQDLDLLAVGLELADKGARAARDRRVEAAAQ